MELMDEYFKYCDGEEVSGVTLELCQFYLEELYKKRNKNIIVLTSSLYEANKIYNGLSDSALLFPMDDFLSSMIVAKSPELKYKRLEVLDKLKGNEKYIIVCNLMGYLKFLPSIGSSNSTQVSVSDVLKRDELVETLEGLGYHRESMATMSGEYAVRGFIVDVFPIDDEHPKRIEFDGNVVESIRIVDESNQMSFGKMDSIRIKAIDEIMSEEVNSLYDYANNPVVVYIDKHQIDASYKKLCEDIVEYKSSNHVNEKLMYSIEDIHVKGEVYLNILDNGKNNINARVIDNYNEDFDKLCNDYNDWISLGKSVYFYLSNRDEEKKLKSVIPSANVVIKSINRGFILDKLVIVSDKDIEKVNVPRKSYKSNFHAGAKIKDYNQIQSGDIVVHIAHGIGRYEGIKTLTVRGVKKDYLTICYDGNDKIYVPVEKINTIYKYTDKDGVVPKLNKLGSSSWTKTRKYIESKVKDISEELIRLYKKRLEVKRKPYKDYAEEDIFASQFEYELTPDQAKSIEEISSDLKRDVPMDRLLCGDVGFGKTEVALRAMFKTVVNNEQVMYLCPTTILSKQQYNVALKRFSKWPVTIELLNRHTSTKEARKILKDFSDGKIDILFGTHRILSSDVKPKRLGMLVVDEEQRFGVSHKERIKELKNDVNVLTLSATPIPRTLKMSMSGLRDMSIIDTPPVDRYPVQTYVVEEDDFLIKDAIYKELSRDGQVFILYNKIDTIQDYLVHISSLVPDARITFAHGRMEKHELDNIMEDFVDRKYDILICTTIIENGIDIPNVNTLIVHNAYDFGLSQLYQIRGRVGRSERIAYAYLTYGKDKLLSEVAVKRLNAIKEFTEFGSGIKIAMRDLSIRGAGDIFGSSQAGFIDSVGLDLYMKMMDMEIRRQNGEEVLEDEEVLPKINVDTHISDDYVSDEDIKIEIHQKINEIDSYDKLLDVKRELEDRFGKVSEEMLVYMYEEWFEKIALKYNIVKLEQTDRYISLFLPEEVSNNIDGGKLLMECLSISKYFNIKYINKEINIILYYKNLEKHFIFYIVTLLERIL